MGAGFVSVVLAGELDVYDVPAVRARLEVLDGPATIDMRRVTYIDSSALRELARVAGRVGSGQITLVVASRNVRRILDLVRFDELFRIVDVRPPSDGVAKTA